MLAAQTKAVAVAAPAKPPPHSWKQIVEPVEPFLKAVAERLGEQVRTFDPEITSYAQYALTNQGKQLRPALVALSAGTVGKPNDAVSKFRLGLHVVSKLNCARIGPHDQHVAKISPALIEDVKLRRAQEVAHTTVDKDLAVLKAFFNWCMARNLAASNPVCRVKFFNDDNSRLRYLTDDEYSRLYDFFVRLVEAGKLGGGRFSGRSCRGIF